MYASTKLMKASRGMLGAEISPLNMSSDALALGFGMNKTRATKVTNSKRNAGKAKAARMAKRKNR